MDCISALLVVEVLLWDFCFLQANPLYCGFMVCRCLWWVVDYGCRLDYTVNAKSSPWRGEFSMNT